MIEKKLFGRLEDGREVQEYILTNQAGVSASFLDLGAIWRTMKIPDREGCMGDVILGYDRPEDYLKNGGHLGEIVGRNANRIGGAKFTLNGKEYQLGVNDGANNLHSGPDFFRKRIWKAETAETEGAGSVTFSLESPEGDQGYPGSVSLSVTYTLTEENEVRIHYSAVSDADTVMNPTNHAYFNMAGHASGSVLEQQVFIDADRITAGDEALIPTGELREVAGTPMDFRVRKAIGRDIDADYDQLKCGGGYDHNWVLNHEPGKVSLSASVWDAASGRMMEVLTDLPGVQFYTGNSLEASGCKEGVSYGHRGGFCFETQYYPDSVNRPEFPSPILRKGETFDSTTIYRFLVKDGE